MLECPLPIESHPTIQLAHGGGGSLTRSLVEELFKPAFDNPWLRGGHDGAILEFGKSRLAFTTDSYVVRPLFFPGGDIGRLAVCGTVNDLAMCGAQPRYLSAGLIIEEGFARHELERIVASMQAAAQAAGVDFVTGDTKVVDRGKGDGVFINTAGIGELRAGVCIGPDRVRPGDAVILSGDIGRHGLAILAAREGLEFASSLQSDCAPLHGAVKALLDAELELHCLRDLTRGGLATALKEIALDSGFHIHIRERAIPVSEPARGAAELLGLDPLYVANEGCMVVILPAPQADAALTALAAVPETPRPVLIGEVKDAKNQRLSIETAIGANRILNLLSGEQLPRIC